MLDPYTDRGGTYPVGELLGWRGPTIPANGVPDTLPVLDFGDFGRGKRFMILSTGKRLVKDRLQHLHIKHALEENYSRVPPRRSNPTRVTSWKDFHKLLERSFGIR